MIIIEQSGLGYNVDLNNNDDKGASQWRGHVVIIIYCIHERKKTQFYFIRNIYCSDRFRKIGNGC